MLDTLNFAPVGTVLNLVRVSFSKLALYSVLEATMSMGDWLEPLQKLGNVLAQPRGPTNTKTTLRNKARQSKVR